MGLFGETDDELAERLKKERRAKLIELRDQTRNKIKDFENHFSTKCEEERTEMIETKKKQIKNLRDETEEQLRNDQESNLELARQKNQIDQIQGARENEQFRSEKVTEQESEDKSNFEEIRRQCMDNTEKELQLKKELGKKQRDADKHEKKRQKKLMACKLSAHKTLNQIKQAEIESDSTNALHQGITDMKLIKNGIQGTLDECYRYLVKDFEWDKESRDTAIKHFGVLATRLQSLSVHIVNMQQMISDIEDDAEREKREKEIEDINGNVSQSGSCIVTFSSQLVSGKTEWDEDRAAKFNDLLKKITSGVCQLILYIVFMMNFPD
ncbi:hypothetical protein CRE_17928 [Caenorhabditis remanei]|uniref:Uncharacterized protein n=1 Tax=Caenorhabditis remanei TaxID=31234 RepID=E3MDL2_CAERE|nr:hypothetical protein CRE_17928 [Caenorhabditis remanei]